MSIRRLQLANSNCSRDFLFTKVERLTVKIRLCVGNGIGPFNRNVTIKGGVVMRSITNNNRRATRDIDLDFIHYSLADESIKSFVDKMNCIEDVEISIDGDIEELKHQDYHGKSVKVKIEDQNGTVISSKIDIGVHKHFEIKQDEYCFDVCMDAVRAHKI